MHNQAPTPWRCWHAGLHPVPRMALSKRYLFKVFIGVGTTEKWRKCVMKMFADRGLSLSALGNRTVCVCLSACCEEL